MALHFLLLLQDEDGNGEISAAELRKLLGQVCVLRNYLNMRTSMHASKKL
jgi:hypothetical protein